MAEDETQTDNGNGRLLARIEERTAAMQCDLIELKALLTAYETRLRCAENTQAKIGERQTISNALQGAWTIIVGTLAAYIGGSR